MPDIVIGLSGEEIINDVVFQVREALKRDCNLRSTDSYGRGYSGQIKLSIKCFALDTADVEVSVNVRPTKELIAGSEEVTDGTPGKEIEVNEDLDIPLETNLEAVRRRSGQGVPMMSAEPDGTPQVRRRNYAPPVVTSQTGVQGGALDETVPE